MERASVSSDSGGSLSGWWCFPKFCEKATPKKTEDNSATGKVETKEGRYYRRRTIHFDLDPNSSSSSRSRSRSSLASSILKLKKGPQDGNILIPPSKHSLKVLMVFSPGPDPVCECFSKAAEKLSFEVSRCTNETGGVQEEYQLKTHDLVMVDARSPKACDYDTLCRSIRNTKGSQHTVLVAIVKKSAFEKDDSTIVTLLESGFNKCIIETTNIVACVNELILLKHGMLIPTVQYATSRALYLALDKCRDIVIMTDDAFKLQYMNSSAERWLGLRHEEALGRTLQEQIATDVVQVNAIASALLRGRDWNGPVTLKRRGHENVVATCRAVPFSCAGRQPTHCILVFDSTSFDQNVLSQSRGSINSLRRGSTDVRSVGSDYRRTSLAKLNALHLEAPITKLIGLIEETRDITGNNPQVLKLLEQAEDIIRKSELYSTHIKEDSRVKADEPVAADLITALLSKAPTPSMTATSRRSSNDSTAYRPSKPGHMKVPAALRDLLDTSLTWEFDIFRLEDLTKRRPLHYLGMNLFNHFDVANTLNCDERTLLNWLTVIEANYHQNNQYHNSTHAADVMQATAGFLEKERMKSIMEPLDEAVSLVAAAAHDVDHPGRSAAYLSNSDSPLAILYNDVSVLESHHSALTFKLTLGDDRVNIFKNLDRERYKIARHNVIDMILATEMTKHFEHLAKFVNVFCTKNSDTEGDIIDYLPLSLPENISLVKRMMIKCADVSNPTRPLRHCVEWAKRIAEEYFQQTDDEKARGLPIVMPMFDRSTCSIPKSQIGFVDYIINDMFEAWNAFLDMPEIVTYMRQNYIRWKEFEEQGYTTLNDVQKLLESLLIHQVAPPVSPNRRKLTD